ncbi:Uma2 family endonuclease [Crocosphaera sp. UHCC 0190]|uniref:Uma2 family endonuclease n=1 Tax=Crocosphaera sp. UHCC 0190 TaxID=3110246 RepID=UPI002B1F96EB|nr:Uma2 family endonuclease [Crocosphaera sp. UHCC 0190]MEA5512139.1 Uma2 family endonuclease [Crocosphaera sp. UHCC 0190]
MVAAKEHYYMTPEEYLEWEEKQPLKYEYMDGEVYAMTGGTLPHAELAFNFASALRNHLRVKGCKILISDAKVQVSEKGPYHYPDVIVSCDERDKKAMKFLQYPCLIVEVLSPSTEGFDRGKKFRNYRKIETLKEYVLVSSEQKLIECFLINDQGIWELYSFAENDELRLTSVDFNCPIELIYEDVLLIDETQVE